MQRDIDTLCLGRLPSDRRVFVFSCVATMLLFSRSSSWTFFFFSVKCPIAVLLSQCPGPKIVKLACPLSPLAGCRSLCDILSIEQHLKANTHLECLYNLQFTSLPRNTPMRFRVGLQRAWATISVIFSGGGATRMMSPFVVRVHVLQCMNSNNQRQQGIL